MTTPRMISSRLAGFPLRALGGLCAVMLLGAAPGLAQGRLEARYEATLSGIPVGKGAWNIEISDDQFSAAASGGTSGLLKAFSGGSGTGAAQGRVVGGALVSTNYSASTTTAKKTEAIRMVLTNGNIKEFTIDPEPPVDPDRLPVTDAHRRGVYDPMTGSMLRVPGTVRSAVAGGLPRRRRDLRRPHALRPEARLQAHGNRQGREGLSRPGRGLRGVFHAGRRLHPGPPGHQIPRAQRNIEIAFAPVAGTRILVPFWMKIPTPLGPAMLEATQFITTATPPRVAKTQ